MFEALDVLAWLRRAKTLDAIRDRDALEARQQKLLRRLLRGPLKRSPFYKARRAKTLEDLPILDKKQWLAAFDLINTKGVSFDEALAVAEEAERSRDFTPTVNGLTVGLSTGTSGRRAVFLVSPAERRRWAGIMLAKVARTKPLKRRRVAFLLRADSGLYQTAGAGPVRFRYFDLTRPFSDIVAELGDYAPEVLVAPASVLRMLAAEQSAGRLQLEPEIVLGVAEIMHADDRAAIEAAFGVRPSEVYQATEGFLAATCEEGLLHLNEEWVIVERDWIDRAARRFVPIVTDLTRATQPVVRYRLDDVLVEAAEPCACGRAAATIEAIEGRCDDVCSLLNPDGAEAPAFPDVMVRSVLAAAPDLQEFQIRQERPGALTVMLPETHLDEARGRVADSLRAMAERQGAAAPAVSFARLEPSTGKRRRVVRVRDRLAR